MWLNAKTNVPAVGSNTYECYTGGLAKAQIADIFC